MYNVEKYLSRCLDSAVNQTFKDIEIIIVNDGSTDNSLSIINDYAQRDSRIRVINQENRGLGEARNAGINIAVGEYIAFMDSDDWMDLYFIERMYKIAKEKDADIVISKHAKVIEGVGIFPSMRYLKPGVISGDEALRKIVSDSGIQSFAWDKLYKRTLFTLHNIRYPKGIYFEDMATTFKLFYYADKVAIINDCLYYYFQRKTGISKKHDPKRVFDNITAVAMIREFLEKEGVFENYIREYQYLCLKMIFVAIFNLVVIYRSTGEPGMISSIHHSLKAINSLMLVNKQERGNRQNSGIA
ncbi:MAG: glycosyltransferase [Clostridiaceae bacterium]|nr:glycosyltransferase [Clostridiaceae bacterium]